MEDNFDVSAALREQLIQRLHLLADPLLTPFAYQQRVGALKHELRTCCTLLSCDDHGRILQELAAAVKPTVHERVRAAVPSLFCAWVDGGGVAALTLPFDVSVAAFPSIQRAAADTTSTEPHNSVPSYTGLRTADSAHVATAELLLSLLVREPLRVEVASSDCVTTCAALPVRKYISSSTEVAHLLVTMPDRVLPLVPLALAHGALTKVRADADSEHSTRQSDVDQHTHVLTFLSSAHYGKIVSTCLARAFLLACAAQTSGVAVTVCHGTHSHTSSLAAPANEYFIDISRLIHTMAKHGHSSALFSAMTAAALDSALRSVSSADGGREQAAHQPPSPDLQFHAAKSWSLLVWSVSLDSELLQSSCACILEILLREDVPGSLKAFSSAVRVAFDVSCARVGQILLRRAATTISPAGSDVHGEDGNTANACAVVLTLLGVVGPSAREVPVPLHPPGEPLVGPARFFEDAILVDVFPYPLLKGLVLAKLHAPTHLLDDGSADLHPVACAPQQFLQRMPFTKYVEHWSEPSFVHSVDTVVQESVSMLLALVLRLCPVGTLDMTSHHVATLLAGIQQRIGATSASVRGSGLYVAQIFSRVFARDGLPATDSTGDATGASTLFLDFDGDPHLEAFKAKIRASDAGAGRHHELQEGLRLETPTVKAPSDAKKSVAGFQETSPAPSPCAPGFIPMPRLSAAAYVYTGRAVVRDVPVGPSAQELEAERLRNHPAMVEARKLEAAAPASIAEALRNLQPTEAGSQGNAEPAPGDEHPLDAPSPYDRFVSALSVLPRVIRRSATSALHRSALPAHAAALLRLLLHLDNRFNVPQFTEWRMQSLVALAVAVPSTVSEALLDCAFGDEVSEATRTECIGVLVMAAQELGGREPAVIPDTPWEATARSLSADPAVQEALVLRDRPTGTASQLVETRAGAEETPESVIAARMFFPLTLRLLRRPAAVSSDFGMSEVDVVQALRSAESFRLGRCPDILHDPGAAPLLAHILKAAAVLVDTVPQRVAGRNMVRLLLPLAWSLKEHPDGSVRLGVLACFGALLSSLHSSGQYAAPSILAPLQQLPPYQPWTHRPQVHAMEAQPPAPAFAVVSDVGYGTAAMMRPASTRRDALLEQDSTSDSDDDDGISLVGRRRESSPAPSPLSVLRNVAAFSSEGAGADLLASVAIGPPKPRDTNASLATAAPQKLGEIVASSPVEAPTSPEAQALLAAITSEKTMWDDVLTLVHTLQSTCASDPEESCRRMAMHLLTSPLVDELVTKPLEALQSLRPPGALADAAVLNR